MKSSQFKKWRKNIPMSLKYLFGVVILLAVVLFLATQMPKWSVDDDSNLLFPDLNAEEIAKVELKVGTTGRETILEKKESGEWIVTLLSEGGASVTLVDGQRILTDSDSSEEEATSQGNSDVPKKADQGKVAAVIGEISQISKDALVSSNPEKHDEFMVSDLGTEVRFSDTEGETLAYLFIGKNGPVFNSQLFRLGGTDEIYQFNRNLSLILNQEFVSVESEVDSLEEGVEVESS